ncbi:ATP-binding protein [Methanobacterium formicicum]|jgi:predicted AAA+ superfamily ATPase|uniref:ATPase n=2 Tax=Methanobacterium formicicum TaxID=2162 RepID=A0A089Z8I1_METFO|nr:AAA family ATPase [Methanobacterium formicicum]AIS31121.1 ATPase [Methanobacterium formicicum]CEL25717.1 ATPase [Methanobacterium formicicum]
MDSGDLLNYVFAKLAEAEKLSQDNTRMGNVPFEHRKTYFQIKKHIDEFLNGYVENRFLIMPGLRGVGKTTILFQIYEYLRNEKGVDSDRILYLSVDELSTYLGAGILEAIDVFVGEVHETSPVYLEKELFIFLDESHYDKEWSQVGKIVYDQSKKIFLIFTGSSALSLEMNVDAARRIKKEPVFPMNFREYNLLKNNIRSNDDFSSSLMDLIFKGDEGSVEDASRKENEMKKTLLKLNKPVKKEWEDFLLCRDFPFALNIQRSEVYERVFDIVNRVVEKDVFSIKSFNTESRSVISRVITFLALQDPGGTSDAKLATKLGKSPRLIREILNILELTHLVFSVKPYGTAGKVVRKAWKYYFLSPTVNAAIRFKLGKYNRRDRKLLGVLTESLVASYFFRMKETVHRPLGIFYDPAKNGVDFLLQTADDGLIPVEVGVGEKDRTQINRAITRYKSEYGIVISNTTSKIKKEGNVIYIPVVTFSFI